MLLYFCNCFQRARPPRACSDVSIASLSPAPTHAPCAVKNHNFNEDHRPAASWGLGRGPSQDLSYLEEARLGLIGLQPVSRCGAGACRRSRSLQRWRAGGMREGCTTQRWARGFCGLQMPLLPGLHLHMAARGGILGMGIWDLFGDGLAWLDLAWVGCGRVCCKDP